MARPDIGIDLDNTIIDYRDVFLPAAHAIGLLPASSGPKSKQAVKANLLEQGGEEAWMRLQGQVYGRFIESARPYPGCEAFVRAVQARGARVAIVSHKTRHGHFDPARIDLWQAARDWLERRDFFAAPEQGGLGIDPDDVHFELDRQAKVARIATVGCRIFIDDLPEVLNHPDFPTDVTRLWFAHDHSSDEGHGLHAFYSWQEVMDNVLSIL